MVAGSYSPFIFKVSGEAFEPGWLCHKWHCKAVDKKMRKRSLRSSRCF